MLIKVPLSWLREHVAVTAGATELAHALHMSGTEVDRVERAGDAWEQVWVGRVAALAPHPNADKLVLATVEYGGGRVKTVVTGAPNLTVGAIVPYAETGARLRDGHGDGSTWITLEPRKIRGVLSEGMVCSARELGLGDDHDGILVLDPGAPVGAHLGDVIGETVLHLELQPNRPDCLGVRGVAREVSALFRLPLLPPSLEPLAFGALDPATLTVRIEDAAGCPRFTAAYLEDVRVGPSPLWMQERLVAAGMRAIDVVVDVTNYVMLELGQPLHAYDATKLRGRTLVARRARAGETLRTLDDVERALDPSILVIADLERPLGLAGILGGEDSEIGPRTTTVALEAAAFDPRGIGRTAAALGLQGSAGSAAARRFAWALSSALPPVALARAVRLLREHAGARLVGALDVHPGPIAPRPVTLRFDDVERVLGAAVSNEEVADALGRLGCTVAPDGERLTVTAPPIRTDIAIAEDVVEEVARIVGYDRIPTRIPSGTLPLRVAHPAEEFRERVRDALVGCGLQEIVSPSLVDPIWLGLLTADGGAIAPAPLLVQNPTSADRSVARTTLRASLLDVARRNLRHREGVALFEIAPVYLPRRGDLPEERSTCAILLAGAAEPVVAGETWRGAGRPFDLGDLAGVLDALGRLLRVAGRGEPAPAPGFHPGRSRAFARDGRTVLAYGQLDPRVAARWDLPEHSYLAELDLELVRGEASAPVATVPPRFPAAYRDLAVVVDEKVPYGDLERELRAALKSGLEGIALLDLFRGPQAGEGKKSFAVRLTFRSADATLDDADLDRAMSRIVGRLRHALGADIR